MSIKTKLPIQASLLLLSTNSTLKDCKAEILLTFVLQLWVKLHNWTKCDKEI